jgi:hypothetical protein
MVAEGNGLPKVAVTYDATLAAVYATGTARKAVLLTDTHTFAIPQHPN